MSLQKNADICCCIRVYQFYLLLNKNVGLDIFWETFVLLRKQLYNYYVFGSGLPFRYNCRQWHWAS